ncbi:methyltransferase type 11 [Pseudonocardia sp. CNS-139]|nr:methyltransferase type 11 [Pseudonocardia sp. CNS-139]
MGVGWSGVADGWAALWGGFAEPAWRALAAAARVGPGTPALDVGCGTGEFLAFLGGLGVPAAGVDPEPEMVALARSRAPGADVRVGDAEHLPWPDATFALVTAVNALQFAGDADDALAELVRVTVPGGCVGVANWAERAHSDLRAIDAALAAAAGDELPPDGDLRRPGGLEELLRDGGLDVTGAGLVDVPWSAPDDDGLLRGVLLGEDPEEAAAAAPAVLAAARPFRTADGGYLFANRFRYAVARKRP